MTFDTPQHPAQTEQQTTAQNWFQDLRDNICAALQKLENTMTGHDAKTTPAGQFERINWDRPGGGGGQMSIMRGRVFEKVGVNISTVWGTFPEQFQKEIKGAAKDPRFWATGISVVAHPQNPLVPAVHMNTRHIVTTEAWFGGGADLNPALPDDADTKDFHAAFKTICDSHDDRYYDRFRKWCDDYFYIKHRNRARGVGGIFYDHLDNDWAQSFAFTQDVGRTFIDIYPTLVMRHMNRSWTQEQREAQLEYRGYYTEFNLMYDRGIRFGLMTNGHTEALLMSLPPEAKWP